MSMLFRSWLYEGYYEEDSWGDLKILKVYAEHKNGYYSHNR